MAAAVGGTVAVVACVEFCADAIKGIPLFHAAEDGSDVPEELVVPAPYSGSEEERIARHAQEDGGRFEDLNPAELANVVKDTIEKGEQRTGRNGRTIFYNPDEGVIVIRDPGQPWGGTAFEGTEQDFENIPED